MNIIKSASRGNQINIAQVIILQSVFTNQTKCWFSRVENQQTQLTYDTGYGKRTRATLVKGKYSHH